MYIHYFELGILVNSLLLWTWRKVHLKTNGAVQTYFPSYSIVPLKYKFQYSVLLCLPTAATAPVSTGSFCILVSSCSYTWRWACGRKIWESAEINTLSWSMGRSRYTMKAYCIPLPTDCCLLIHPAVGLSQKGEGGRGLDPASAPPWNGTLYRGLWRAAILGPSQPPWATLSPLVVPSF